jgi:predicted transcriptional regulator
MGTNTVTSIRMPEDLRRRYDELARVTGLTRNDLLLEAMEQYLERELHEIALIQEGLAQIDAGETSPLDEVLERFIAQGMFTRADLEQDRARRETT